jgi:Mrp family chromosome partitioning ATPase
MLGPAGIGLAFVRDVFDTRVRSSAEVSETLGTTLLARIPEPPKNLRDNNRLVMTSNPNGPHAEAFRMLRANLEFVNLDRGARSIMVTSALEDEGKSTTVSNLAVARARARRSCWSTSTSVARP